MGNQGFGRATAIDGAVLGALGVAVPVARLDAQVVRDILAALVRMTEQIN